MTIQRMPGSAITPGTITITQLESNVATVVSTGGGPKITNIQVTDNAYTVLDDTAVDITGGYIKITGTGFVTGCSVIVGQLPAASVTFISSTEVRAQLSAQSAGTYIVYLVNPDGGVGIRVNGVTHSASPAWQTASGLPDQYDGVAINLSLVATDATSYTITSGSLPPGLSLNSNTGVISGTVSGVANDTLYTFTVRATDAQLQDSPRTFTVTITVSDAYFKLTTLLLSGSAISANTVVRDSSTNNFNLTVSGDARASNFTPYGGGWSAYFDGTGDYLQVPYSATNDLGTGGNWTVELWFYMPLIPGDAMDVIGASNGGGNVNKWMFNINMNTSYTYTANRVGFSTYNSADRWINAAYTWAAGTWYHIAAVYDSTNTTLYVNGQSVGSMAYNASSSSSGIRIGSDGEAYKYFTGYISNTRVVKGTALYTANFTPATTTLTAVANTSLLTCHTNRFLDGSTNNFTVTRNGDARVVSFNPFNITNTGVNGSAYFDGSGDYVTVPSSASLGIGASDYTVEGWFYTTDVSALRCVVTYGSGTFRIFFNASNIWFLDGGTSLFQPTGVIVPYLWNHMAIVRSGSGTNNTACFLNGTRIAQVTNTANFSTAALTIGAEGAGSYYIGYMSNLRIVKGTALYDPSLTTYTVPTSPLTAVANTQLLTLQYRQPHNNHTFLDSSSNQFLITRMGNATQGTFSPFGPGRFSRYFVNYESYNLSSMLTGWGLGLTTTELWLNSPSRFGIANAYDCVAANGRYGLQVGTDRKVYVTFTTGTGSQFDLSTTNLVTFNQWNHIAIQIDARTNTSAVITVYINGVGETFASQNMSTQTGLWANPTVGRGQTGCFSFANDTGYVSDYRIVKDEFVYTGNFTPPTAPLAVSGALSANAYPSLTNVSTTWTSANCIVLMYSASSNRPDNIKSGSSIVLTKGTDTRTTNFSPYQNSAVYSPVVHGGSAYFDGSGDYLTFVNNNQINFGSSPFTIEVWFYSVSTNTRQDFITQWATNNKSSYLGIGITGVASRIQFAYSTTGGNELAVTDTTNFVPYQWYHVAACRTANTISLFVNGVRVATTTETGAIFNSTKTPITVGAYSGNSGEEGLQPLVGYLGGLRVIKGSSVYDATQTSITVPAVPVSSTSNTQLLLNFTDAAILDSTGRTVLETMADSKTSSVVTKFTGGSMYFDGTGDAINIRSSDLLTFGTGDWTVEFWVYHTSVSGQQTYLGDTGGATSGPYIYKDSSHKVGLYYSSQILTGTTTIAINTWYYIVLSRASGTVRLFINGIQETSASDTTNLSVAIQWVGGDTLPSGYLSGYMNDIRVTKGYARYTANFTAPTAPARLK